MIKTALSRVGVRTRNYLLDNLQELSGKDRSILGRCFRISNDFSDL
jgi:hypothetical protein